MKDWKIRSQVLLTAFAVMDAVHRLDGGGGLSVSHSLIRYSRFTSERMCYSIADTVVVLTINYAD